MANVEHDPWVKVKTFHGLPTDQVISALQKEIRRGNTENAVLLAYEMSITSPELETYLWQRLMVISVEDIGFGDTNAPVLIHTLYQMIEKFHLSPNERKVMAVHGVRYLCSRLKDRSSDEMYNLVKHAVEKEGVRPVIPDYALDMHTEKGRAMGRGKRHFYQEGAKVSPEMPGREASYLQRLMEILNKDEIA
jgi:replication-associated recombination protein RarA